MDYQALLDRIHAELEPRFGEGRVASYIPELANVAPERFAMALVTTTGEHHAVGDADEKFSIQSISKVFALAIAMQLGGEAIWARCGREPSGNPFNSLVQLEAEAGIPRNPFINAGALVVTDLILSHRPDPGDPVLDFIRRVGGDEDVHFNPAVAASEAATGHRNAAMAHFLKSFGNLHNPAADVLEAYFRDCSIEMSCRQIAESCLFLASRGRSRHVAAPVMSESDTKYLNALMLTCGTYDAVGEFAHRVGLPAKSGVGGGIVATLPGRYSVCVWSPGLDDQGNSALGTCALDLLTSYSGLSIF